MGQSLVKGNIPYKKAIIYIVVYSLLTPIGILLGKVLKDISHDNYKMLGILMAIPIGIFIYISIVEIILEEFLVSDHKVIKFVSLLSGVMLIYVLTLFESHQH